MKYLFDRECEKIKWSKYERRNFVIFFLRFLNLKKWFMSKYWSMFMEKDVREKGVKFVCKGLYCYDFRIFCRKSRLKV